MKIDNFIPGETYKGNNGLDYIYIETQNNIASFKLRNAIKKFRTTFLCGVMTAMDSFGTKIVAKQIKPIYDEEIDGIRTEKKIIFNTNGETYVNLFKRHKEEKESN